MYAQFYIFRAGSVCSIKVVAPKVIFFPPAGPQFLSGIYSLTLCHDCIRLFWWTQKSYAHRCLDVAFSYFTRVKKMKLY